MEEREEREEKKEETSGENPSIRAIESTHGFETSSCTGGSSRPARAASDEVYLHDLWITCGRGNKRVGGMMGGGGLSRSMDFTRGKHLALGNVGVIAGHFTELPSGAEA